MKKALHMKEGSAILIALFLMATLGAISFGSSRTFISEIRTTTNLTETVPAYYAAEGALESALLDVRINKNAEIPVLTDTPKVRGTVETAMKKKITYKTELSKTKCYSKDSECFVEKDQTISLTLPKLPTSFVLHWKWGATAGDGQNIVRITKTDSGLSSDGYAHDQGYVAPVSVTDYTLNSTGSGPFIYRFRPMKGDLKTYWITNTNTSIDPIVDSGETTIDAKGEYKNTTRQLQAKINRQDGRLLSIFDYTLLTHLKIND